MNQMVRKKADWVIVRDQTSPSSDQMPGKACEYLGSSSEVGRGVPAGNGRVNTCSDQPSGDWPSRAAKFRNANEPEFGETAFCSARIRCHGGARTGKK